MINQDTYMCLTEGMLEREVEIEE